MSASQFYQKYRRLFFEDDQEPLAFQLYHSRPAHAAISDLGQWLSAPEEPSVVKLKARRNSGHSKVRLPPLEDSPIGRKPIPEPVLPSQRPRQLTPLSPRKELLDAPRKPTLQFQPLAIEAQAEDIRPDRSPESVPKSSIKIIPRVEDTRERVFPDPKKAPQRTGNPLQTAIQRRKEAKQNLDQRRSALQVLIQQTEGGRRGL